MIASDRRFTPDEGSKILASRPSRTDVRPHPSLPEDTRLYCAHEYTLANARFAHHAEPQNEAIAVRLKQVEALREEGKITLPTDVAIERGTNPFVRASNAQEFARLRREKDSFRS